MPPYSAQNEVYTTDEVYAFPQSLKTAESVDISPPALTLTPSTDSHDSSVLTTILCGGGVGLPANPFKHRTCAECGGACSKFQGYRKELVPAAAANTTLFDEDDSVGASQDKTTMKKQYYHKRCYQVKQDRDAHKLTSGLVTVVLPEFMDYLRIQEEEKTRVARQAELEATAELERLAALLSVGVHKTTPRTSTQHVLRASLVKIKNGFAKTSLLARKKKKKTKQPQQPVVVWQEYTDPASGNTYWSSDGVTTTWDKPTTGSIRAYEL